MTPFQMDTDARARSVAKQLRDNLSGRGIALSLGKCREATAKLYGYPDWRTLASRLGEGRSDDDALVAEAERSTRHDAQRAVLVDLGLPSDAADALRASLSPTGRSAQDVRASEPAMLEDTVQYHPVRFREAVESVARQMMFSDMAERGIHPTPVECLDIETPSTPLFVIGMAMLDFGCSTAVTPLDGEAFDAETLDITFVDATEIAEGKGVLIDASAAARDLALADVSEEAYAGAWDGMPFTYVHLGTNAFPSPFPYAGIEGCYIQVREPEDGLPREDGGTRGIEVTFVASPETTPGLSMGEDLTIDPRDALAWSMRTVSLSIDTEETDGSLRLGDLVDAPNYGERTDEYVDLWRPYLLAPLNAAWNAIRAEREATLPCRDGTLRDVDGDLVRKLARARTPAMRRRAAMAIARENDEVVVRFVGGVTGQAVDAQAGFPAGVDSEVEDPFEWADAYFRMARHANLPEAALRFAERALDILRVQADGAGPEEFAAYHSIREQAFSTRGRWSEALDEALLCIGHDFEDTLSTLVRLPALAVRAGREAGASRTLSSPRLTDAELAWSEALLLAGFGGASERDAAIARASRIDVGTAMRLLGEPPQMRVSERDIDAYNGVPPSIVALQRDGWEAIEGYRDLILAAMPAIRA